MPDILKVVDIQAAANVVFETVGKVAGIRRWWSPDVTGSDEVGGEITVRFGADWKVVMEKIDEVANEHVAYRITGHDSDEWPGTELHFELSTDDEWTTLKFDHRGWATKTDFFRFCSTKWVPFLLSIKQAAETGEGTPWPDEIRIGPQRLSEQDVKLL